MCTEQNQSCSIEEVTECPIEPAKTTEQIAAEEAAKAPVEEYIPECHR